MGWNMLDTDSKPVSIAAGRAEDGDNGGGRWWSGSQHYNNLCFHDNVHKLICISPVCVAEVVVVVIGGVVYNQQIHECRMK